MAARFVWTRNQWYLSRRNGFRENSSVNFTYCFVDWTRCQRTFPACSTLINFTELGSWIWEICTWGKYKTFSFLFHVFSWLSFSSNITVSLVHFVFSDVTLRIYLFILQLFFPLWFLSFFYHNWNHSVASHAFMGN